MTTTAIDTAFPTQPSIASEASAAHQLHGEQRQHLAVQVLAG